MVRSYCLSLYHPVSVSISRVRIGKLHFFITLIGDKRSSKNLTPQSILDLRPTKTTATKLVTAESSRDSLRDTSVNPKNPYHTKKYFEGRLFRSLFFFARFASLFCVLNRISNESCGSLLEILLSPLPCLVKNLEVEILEVLD